MNQEYRLTIFTPTYNRAYILPQLYDSLCRQSFRDFKWLIVNDGSDDETEQLVKCWQQENRINIIYHYQKNAGKMSAHNKGVLMCDTDLFTCVDSDDCLTEDAVEIILHYCPKGMKNIGLLAKKGKNKEHEWTSWNGSIEYKTMFDAERENGLRGDTFLVFKTQILRKYLFPVAVGEKFVPEAWLYDALSKEGELLFLDKVLYIADYLEDGYTAQMGRINAQNPQGYLLYIQQRLKMDKRIKDKMKDTIRYIAIKGCLENRKVFSEAVYPMLAVLLYPLGRVLYLKKYQMYLG